MFNKEQAIELMKSGKRITHVSFSQNEWMTIFGNKIVFEDQNSMTINEFFSLRSSMTWEEGYNLFNDIRKV